MRQKKKRANERTFDNDTKNCHWKIGQRNMRKSAHLICEIRKIQNVKWHVQWMVEWIIVEVRIHGPVLNIDVFDCVRAFF